MEENENKMLSTPMELFGVECGKGWEKLYKPLFEYIEEYNKNKENEEDKICVLQCKEKFGSLRFYTNFVTEELSKMISKAEHESWNICECCGSEKYIGHTNGYIRVMCVDCLQKYIIDKDNFYPIKAVWTSHSNGKQYYIDKDNINEVLKKVKKQK